jgi:predicted phage terminase large subunit-like protein
MLTALQRAERIRSKLEPYRRQRATSPTDPPPLAAYYRARYPSYHYARHIALLVETLEQLQPGDALILNLPPRHGKSETVGAYAEWYLGAHPNANIIYASYSAALAYRRSRQIRNEIRDGRAFRRAYPHVALEPDARKVSQWQLTSGAGFIAAGVGGSITGMGATLAIIDDPLKGRRQAESLRVREAVIDWFRGDLFTRLEPDSILIVIQTRWHRGDLAGWLLEQRNSGEFGDYRWQVLSLPALAEDDDPLGRAPGEALWPERWPADKLARNRQLLGEYDWASLYQQRPYLRGGAVFSDAVPRCEVTAPLPEGARITITADLAASTRTAADYTVLHVGATWGQGAEMTGRVLEVCRGQWGIRRQIAEMLELQRRYGQPIYIERSPNAIPVIQQARSEGVQLIPVAPEGDKFSRAQPYAAAWNAGRVEVPFAPWATAYISELTSFKGDGSDEADDQVDAAAYWWRIAGRYGSSWSVKGETA